MSPIPITLRSGRRLGDDAVEENGEVVSLVSQTRRRRIISPSSFLVSRWLFENEEFLGVHRGGGENHEGSASISESVISVSESVDSERGESVMSNEESEEVVMFNLGSVEEIRENPFEMSGGDPGRPRSQRSRRNFGLRSSPGMTRSILCCSLKVLIVLLLLVAIGGLILFTAKVVEVIDEYHELMDPGLLANRHENVDSTEFNRENQSDLPGSSTSSTRTDPSTTTQPPMRLKTPNQTTAYTWPSVDLTGDVYELSLSNLMCRSSTNSIVCISQRLGLCVVRNFGKPRKTILRAVRTSFRKIASLVDPNDEIVVSCMARIWLITAD